MTAAAPKSDARILLMGMMGAGKSTVGREIATREGWSYLDNDELVVRATGRTARDILDNDGVAALREAESAALTEALRLDPPVVAGVAGGTVLVPGDRSRLAAQPAVVWLRARVDTLVARVGSGEDRPWLAPDPRTAMIQMITDREPYYEQVADLIVDVDDKSPAEVADLILAKFESGPASTG
jgi:shikimate kinase